ncbi:MAG TPA: alpha/beta fold hydrolase [Thermoanaerobaculia bacterium]|nr:alpha/beta fold hydrolase [Thermoanaerobaculia bacterium]
MRRVGGILLLVLASRTASAAPPEAAAAADPWLARPVDDQNFQTYLEFFAYDRKVPFDSRVIGNEEKDGVKREHLSFQSTRDARFFANLYRAAGSASGKPPSVVLLHGGSSAGKDDPFVPLMATLIARAGYMVLAIDMRYFGERSTDLLKTFIEQEKYERLYNQPPLYLAWITQTVKDVSRSYDLLVEERGADARRVALIGMSRGAIVATIAGAADRRLAAVALLYGGHFGATEREHLPAACPANYIGRISPRPLLMINGTRDTVMNKEASVEPLQRLAKPPRTILWAETGHQTPTEEHRSALLRWLQESLK